MYKNTFKNLSKYAVLELVPDLRVLSSLCVSFPQPGRSSLTLSWPRWHLQNTALSSQLFSRLCPGAFLFPLLSFQCLFL